MVEPAFLPLPRDARILRPLSCDTIRLFLLPSWYSEKMCLVFPGVSGKTISQAAWMTATLASDLEVLIRGLVGMDVPLGSGQGRDSLNSHNLESAFPDLSGWVPSVCPQRAQRMSCCGSGLFAPSPDHPTAILAPRLCPSGDVSCPSIPEAWYLSFPNGCSGHQQTHLGQRHLQS